DSEPDADDLRARSDAAWKRLLRPAQSGRLRPSEDLPDSAVSVLGSDGSVQLGQFELHQEPDDDARVVVRTGHLDAAAAHAAPRDSDEVLIVRPPSHRRGRALERSRMR